MGCGGALWGGAIRFLKFLIPKYQNQILLKKKKDRKTEKSKYRNKKTKPFLSLARASYAMCFKAQGISGSEVRGRGRSNVFD